MSDFWLGFAAAVLLANILPRGWRIILRENNNWTWRVERIICRDCPLKHGGQ